MPDAPSESDDPFERAVALHQAGDVAGAIAIYRDLLAQEGEDAVLLELLGAALGETGEFAQALDLLDRAVALDDGESSTARLQRGIVREAAGDGIGAIEDFRLALAADPGSASVAERLGHALIAADEWSEAVGMLDTTIAVQATTVPGTDPGLLALRRTRGDALLRLGRLDEAERELDRVLSLRPEDETALALRTRLLATRGDANEALASARLAHQHHPESAALHINLLTALASTEDPADAEEVQDRLRNRVGPALAERDRIRLDAMAALVLGDADHAIDSLTAWTAAHPDDVEALGALGTALRRTGRVREAIATLRHAVELAPQTLGLEVELGRARLEAGDA
ncbi:MAG: tetratricopeptide repeat protein, partial [Planctomycetota bacterium]